MIIEEMGKIIASYGLPGAMLVVMAWAYYQKDKALLAEQKARIEDAKMFNTMALEIQKQVITAVQQLSDLVDTWEKREEQRELRERRSS